MNTVGMLEPAQRPVDDRESHLDFEPFSPLEWVLTALLVLICFGIPLFAIVRYQVEMDRLNAAPVVVQEMRP